jgi:hypothetical protein
VKVRINQYPPRDDWRRLRKNKALGWARPTLLMEVREEKHRKQIQQLDPPMLDAWGCVPAGTGGAELLFDVLSTASE